MFFLFNGLSTGIHIKKKTIKQTDANICERASKFGSTLIFVSELPERIEDINIC